MYTYNYQKNNPNDVKGCLAAIREGGGSIRRGGSIRTGGCIFRHPSEEAVVIEQAVQLERRFY